jgi:hypothetical protein
MKLRNVILLLLAGLVSIGVTLAVDYEVETSGNVPSICVFTPPVGGAMPTLDPEAAQPIKKADSFKVKCNGPFDVNAVAQETWMAANGKMTHWDTILGVYPLNGKQLTTPMHLVGTGTNSFGDKDLGQVTVQLVSGLGTPETIYNFDWSQTVLFADYPDNAYKLEVKFGCQRVV